MFDINSLGLDHFKINLENETIDINPPKIKVLKSIIALSKITDETAFEELTNAVCLILNSNKQNKVITLDWIEETFDIQMIKDFLTEYFKWVTAIKNNPN